MSENETDTPAVAEREENQPKTQAEIDAFNGVVSASSTPPATATFPAESEHVAGGDWVGSDANPVVSVDGQPTALSEVDDVSDIDTAAEAADAQSEMATGEPTTEARDAEAEATEAAGYQTREVDAFQTPATE